MSAARADRSCVTVGLVFGSHVRICLHDTDGKLVASVEMPTPLASCVAEQINACVSCLVKATDGATS